MKMTPERHKAVSEALDAVWSAAAAAKAAGNTEAARAALNRVWFAVHTAQEVLTDAEQSTYRERVAEMKGDYHVHA